MPKASPAYTAFNAGEWSPLLEGRQDLSKYFSALRRMRNFYPKVQGPAIRRPGTRHVAEVKDSTRTVRLLPFEFSVQQAYIIEAGSLYLRFFRDNARIETAPDVAYEIASPYQESDLAALKFVQSADVLYLFHPAHMPRKLSRFGDTNWTLTPIEPADGPYLPANTTPTTLTPSATSGSVTVTASATEGLNGGAGFKDMDIGRLIRLKVSGVWGYGEITAWISTTQVTVQVERNFGAASATADWRLGLWSGATGYPGTGTFYEDRMALAGVPDFPQRLDLSRTGDYENFMPTEADGTVVSDNALAFTLNANNVNAIRWLLDHEKALMAGTVGGEWPLSPSNAGEALDAANPPQARRATVYGSADVTPIKAGGTILFVQRAGRKIFEQAFAFESDGFRAGDLTELAGHVSTGGLTELAYQREPDSILWAVRADGGLIGLTYRREQDVVGWHQHVPGGKSDAAGAPSRVESLAVIPSSNGSRDELWLVVQRRINGFTRRFIEYLEAPLADDADQTNSFYVDSGLIYDGPAIDTLSGLDHLEGETVQILADGGSHPDRIVAGGAITLDRFVSKAAVGLAYDHLSVLQTLDIEAGAADGTAQGKIKRITGCTIRLHRSLGVWVGPDEAAIDPLPELVFRDPSTEMGSPAPLYSGDSFIPWPGGYDRFGRVTVVPRGPFPCTFVAIYPQLITQDR
ncbi:MAG: hypothetical protein OEU46_15435 [Alphaproteobacteria bacterium]|nr:hypothetical protein [Alphaproteobacteria bacterium]